MDDDTGATPFTPDPASAQPPAPAVLRYKALVPRQPGRYTVLSFCARAADVLAFAQIDRIGRRADGSLTGFQRPQVAGHIREIRQYLAQPDAILPNSVVVAFTEGVTLGPVEDGSAEVAIDVSAGPKGFVVDGQQRLTALASLGESDFEVLVSALLCGSEEELRKQFILVNNTRPLPKSLLYELLPSVGGLPHRLSSRTTAAALVERLNYDETSSLRGQIKQHTNPLGVLQDTVMQKLIMSSLSDGVLRELMRDEDGMERSFRLLSDFFEAVQLTFPDAWKDRTPKTSRLVHGAGLLAMGYVMEHLHQAQGAIDVEAFHSGLAPLQGQTAWTDGHWDFGGERRPWNALQNVSRDYLGLANHLLRLLRRASGPHAAKALEADG
jgi:DGQHR domain-containing protein